MTVPGIGTPDEIARWFVGGRLALFGLNPKDISSLRTSRNFLTKHNGVTHLTLQQQVKGKDVFGTDSDGVPRVGRTCP